MSDHRAPLRAPDGSAQPRVPPSYIARARLNELLDRGTRGPLTVVTAGAGWGKTLATASWAARRQRSDLSPGSPWKPATTNHAVLDLLRRSRAQGRRRARPATPWHSSYRVSGALATGLQRLARRHRAAAHTRRRGPGRLPRHRRRRGARRTSATLLRNPPEQLRLVMLTRSDPLLPLHRMRIRRGLFEIRSRDLAFDEADATAMLAADDVSVTPDDVELLVRPYGGMARRACGSRRSSSAGATRPGALRASPATTRPSPTTSSERCWPARPPRCGVSCCARPSSNG